MLVVRESYEKMHLLVNKYNQSQIFDNQLAIAADNAPSQIVISGRDTASMLLITLNI